MLLRSLKVFHCCVAIFILCGLSASEVPFQPAACKEFGVLPYTCLFPLAIVSRDGRVRFGLSKVFACRTGSDVEGDVSGIKKHLHLLELAPYMVENWKQDRLALSLTGY